MGQAAVELLTSGLLAKAADLAGLNGAKSPDQAGVWLYSDAVPKGVLTNDDAALIMRAVGLSQSDNIPKDLVDHLIEDVRAFVAME